MRFSEQWLREWVNPELDTDALAQQLTMAGLEVDSVETAAPAFSKVIVGQVVACEKHPDADRLNVCQVDIAESEPLNIVCGGVNVRQGIKVPVAVVGAVLPGDFKIKKSKIRGVTSQGMICSTSELGVEDGREQKGHIMELAGDAPLGTSFRDYLQLDDHIFDIELTPNRADCLSIAGVAREVAANNKADISAIKLEPMKPTIDDVLDVSISAQGACPRYTGRVVKGINKNAQTPVWMTEKLRRAGVRCIHPAVDICNYVMLELGQPMHAFDISQLSGGIEVRFAKANEKITVLDGSDITLTDSTLVIADNQQAQAIAGVMGGLESAVGETSEDIFLESAFFNPVQVRRDAKRHGLPTDSSYRFERGVDYQLQTKALERATQLVLEIVGGKAGPVIEVVAKEALPQERTVTLRREQIQRLLGVSIDDAEVERILKALGMGVEPLTDGWQLSVPSYRFDIEQEADLIEELARIYGYDAIPMQSMRVTLAMEPVSETRLTQPTINKLLVARGYFEAITYSFIDKELQQLFYPDDADMIELTNPIASNMNVMRRSIWPGLIEAARYNLNRQNNRVRLFESGLCFENNKGDWLQTHKLGLIACGNALDEQWGEKTRKGDFYDIKGDIEALLGLSGAQEEYEWVAGEHTALHPGQTAILQRKGVPCGVLGALHPVLAKKLDMAQPCFLFEGVTEHLSQVGLPQYSQVSKYPGVRRDLAFVLDRSVAVGDVLTTIRSKVGEILVKLQVFDIYQGEHVEKDKKSVALGLTFQDPSRTLVDSEISEVIQNVVDVLKSEFNATLRS